MKEFLVSDLETTFFWLEFKNEISNCCSNNATGIVVVLNYPFGLSDSLKYTFLWLLIIINDILFLIFSESTFGEIFIIKLTINDELGSLNPIAEITIFSLLICGAEI